MAGVLNQPENTIILNASGLVLDTTQSGFYVNPVNNNTTISTNVVLYNSTTKELVYNSTYTGGASGVMPVPTGESSIYGSYLYWDPTEGAWLVGNDTVHIGTDTGKNSQGGYAVAIGSSAGQTNQGTGAIAIGSYAGKSIQGLYAVAIGANAGSTNQGDNAVAIGVNTGIFKQGDSAVAIGDNAGQTKQGQYAIAIGLDAGNQTQGASAVAIGAQAGQTKQGSYAVAIGLGAGNNTQGHSAVAIGALSGEIYQGSYAVAIGNEAGNNSQESYAVAIGYQAGQTSQGTNSIAIGANAGSSGQKQNSIAIGTNAGQYIQNSGAIAIGYQAGNTNQGTNSIAIGINAGRTNQGNYSIAIGTNVNSRYPNSIVLNATSTALNSDGASGFYVKPIRNLNLTTALVYNASSGEISYATSGVKTFVIDHPVDENKYLVHACLEGPEAGVYYRGDGEITNNESVVIHLPEYVDKLAKNLTVQITPINNGTKRKEVLDVSRVKNNSFTVYGENSEFFWTVYGERNSIITEPNKKDVNVRGDGPYKYIY